MVIELMLLGIYGVYLMLRRYKVLQNSYIIVLCVTLTLFMIKKI